MLMLSLLPDIMLLPQGQASDFSTHSLQHPFLGGAFRVLRILYLEQMRNLLEGNGVVLGLQTLEGTGLGFPKALAPSPVVQHCSEGHRKGWNFWNAESTGVPCPVMVHLPGLRHPHRVHLTLALLWLPTQPRASQGQAVECSPCLGPLTGQTVLHLPEQADREHPEKEPQERLLRG